MPASSASPRRPQVAVAQIIGLVVVAAVGLILLSSGQEPQRIVITATTEQRSIADLTASAEIIAIVVPTGSDDAHWNNADNSRWESDDSRIVAMIYNDQTVEVLRVLKGDAPSQLTIRNIGGTVDRVEFVLEGLRPLRAGSQYLVYLERVETPTREGAESAISFVAQGQGLFELTDSVFVNSAGLNVSPSDLQ